jgi:pilus assembly protein CpaB
MKLKSLVLMAIAAACGLVAMVGVQQVLSGDKQEKREVGMVLVAMADIPPGHPLNETNTVFKEWDKGNIPEGAVTSKEQFEQRSLRVGAVPNEVIMQAKLGKKGDIGVSSAIPEGMRVATVQVNTTKTHSGSIMPGDRVDVVVTYKSKAPGVGMVTKTKAVLEFIQVFATDNIRQGSAASTATGEQAEINAKNISLLVTPDQYNLLMLAETKGQLTLALRSAGDETIADAAPVDDMIFDDAATSHGTAEQNPDENQQVMLEDGPKTEKTGDVRSFLNEEEAKKEAAAADGKEKADKEKKKPKGPTWTIRVYDGDELREEEVELSQPKAEPGYGADGNSKSWTGWLQSTFSGGK